MKLRQFLLVIAFFSLAPYANAQSVTLKTDFKIWEKNFSYLDLTNEYQKHTYLGVPVAFDSGDILPDNLELTTETVEGVDLKKVQAYLDESIAPEITREKEDVRISKNDDGEIVFEGRGLYGRSLNTEMASYLVKKALEDDYSYIELPLRRQDPEVIVQDPELKEMGVTQLVSAGETEFSGSPYNRRNNIRVGLSKFNGHVIEPGSKFTFGNVLGPVEPWTGYLPELVIKGDRTVPEYGGGLCQVSTTLYRAILSGGFPVNERRNHSYQVRYYSPVGLDATVYPPAVDLEFTNDSDSHLLVQAFTEGDKAYYNFYGTKDNRTVDMVGPFYSNYVAPPPPKTEKTTKLKPGEKEVLGHAVPGITANWYRKVEYADPEKEPYTEHIYSKYQARPDFIAVGVESEESLEDSIGVTY